MKRLFLIILPISLLSCSGNEKAPSKTGQGSTVHAGAADTIATAAQPVVLQGCYQRIMQRDTATLQLHPAGDRLTGQLDYNFFQKDDNTGSVEGKLQGDLLIADYVFLSEGLTSRRQVAFKIQDTVLWEGYGPSEERAGRSVFLHPEALQFDSAHPFVKVSCPPGHPQKIVPQ